MNRYEVHSNPIWLILPVVALIGLLALVQYRNTTRFQRQHPLLLAVIDSIKVVGTGRLDAPMDFYHGYITVLEIDTPAIVSIKQYLDQNGLTINQVERYQGDTIYIQTRQSSNGYNYVRTK